MARSRAEEGAAFTALPGEHPGPKGLKIALLEMSHQNHSSDCTGVCAQTFKKGEILYQGGESP